MIEALKAAREVLQYLRDKTALDDLDRLAIAGALAKIDALTGGDVV